LERDPFLRWVEEAGFQFSFSRLKAGPVDAAAYFYSSHASVKRSTLLEVGGFDEKFPFLAEDTELGIRLRRAGVQLDYHPELEVFHDHPHDVAAFARRMRLVGEAACRLHERWPDDAPAVMIRPDRPRSAYALASALGRVLLASGARGWLRERAWTARLMAAYARGYESGTSAL
jgi:hypothetical protein